MGKGKNVVAIFDIGKTNKKFFLFDANYRIVHQEYTRFEPLEDGDGYPAENLVLLKEWMVARLKAAIASKEYHVTAVNFSTYGASLVHINTSGEVITPVYDYTKPLPRDTTDAFYKTYGGRSTIAQETASPQQGALNSGLQLYWLKWTKPHIFKKIAFSLHLPQYLSYMFTGVPISEYTSVGCHTNLWNFETKAYHRWVHQERIAPLLPPMAKSRSSVTITHLERKLRVGMGIHDSSSALIPYFLGQKVPFLLLSTGTWNVALNPYGEDLLSQEDMERNGLCYLQMDGTPVRAARLFLGKEFEVQVVALSQFFGKAPDYHTTVEFDMDRVLAYKRADRNCFDLKIPLRPKPVTSEVLQRFESFEQGYHQLMIELVAIQAQTIRTALGRTKKIQRMYVDGGFSNNRIFMKLLAHTFGELEVMTTDFPSGAALGGAMAITHGKVGAGFLEQHYTFRHIEQPIWKVE
ncbi:MAG: FGGY-family carbohydrate kinase [Flavobacteriaceae bacterium]